MLLLHRLNRLAEGLSCRLLLVIILLMCAPPVIAHQQKEAYITLLFNQNTNNLEISHRFLVHDAEHVFARLFVGAELTLSGDLLGDPASQLAFSKYVESEFSIADADQLVLEPISVGYEVEGKYFWVYQEMPIPDTQEILIKHRALQAFWANQINHVNVEKDGKVSSVRLQKRDGHKWSAIMLPQSPIE